MEILNLKNLIKKLKKLWLKVAQGENPYLNDKDSSFEKTAKKRWNTGHEYCKITSSGNNNSIFIALSAIEGLQLSYLIREDGMVLSRLPGI